MAFLKVLVAAFQLGLIVFLGPCVECKKDGEGIPFLHENKHVACSACTETATIIAHALEHPSPELLHQGTVRERINGQYVNIPYAQSQQYADDVLTAVCNSSLVATLVRTEDWLGMPYYTSDTAPVYTTTAQTDRSLFTACKKLTRRLLRPKKGQPHLRDVVKVHGAWGAARVICTDIFSDCRWRRSWSGWLSAGMEQAVVHDPSLVLRLAPLVATVATVLALVVISVQGAVRTPPHLHNVHQRVDGRKQPRAKRKQT